MESLMQFWSGLGRSARAGFLSGAAAILLAVAAIGYWALHVDYGVLFADLSQPDLATMASELDKLKVPYKVGASGDSLLVPENVVHKTRVALMGRELPLRGAVGFELFNNMEFGVSEFVQKVAYQRALQGELTRTILAIDEIQSARVHLALTEQGLFRKDAAKSKASVTLTTKAGRVLQAAQVHGIQRLIAASVSEVQAQDVTILDQHGVALSRVGQGEGAAFEVVGTTQLDMKRNVEAYLAQKAAKVLDRMFGAGESVVSVDAVLSQDQTRVTTEEVLAARATDASQPAAGVVLRERQTTRSGASEAARATGDATVTNSETDYQTGKRVEQVVSPPGGVKQLNVAVVVKQSLPEAELQRVRDLVAASVGANRTRGDQVTVLSMEHLVQADAAPRPEGADVSPAPRAAPSRIPDNAAPAAGNGTVIALLATIACAVAMGAALVAVATRRRRRPNVALALDDAERARVLQSVQQWLTHDPAHALHPERK